MIPTIAMNPGLVLGLSGADRWFVLGMSKV
jgi:hypothetical protein